MDKSAKGADHTAIKCRVKSENTNIENSLVKLDKVQNLSQNAQSFVRIKLKSRHFEIDK